MVNTLPEVDHLKKYSNNDEILEELLQYTRNRICGPEKPFKFSQLEDEPLVKDWEQYVVQAKSQGVFFTLKKHLIQFQFPIKKNISQTKDYKGATLRGYSIEKMPTATGLDLLEPTQLELYIHPTLAGKVPVLVVPNREDFKSLIRALCYRNEPQSIPDSMGAAMIKGLNNWHRLRKACRVLPQNEVIKDRSLYQDRIIVLSRIPYSNVQAHLMNQNENAWLANSLKIRLEHECAHYFTLRHFGIMSNNMHDEILADYKGICSVLPYFNAEWFLRFVGLENYPVFRKSGRLKNYLGRPSLSDGAFEILQWIVKDAADNLECFDAGINQLEEDKMHLVRMCTICNTNLVEMARQDGSDILKQKYDSIRRVL